LQEEIVRNIKVRFGGAGGAHHRLCISLDFQEETAAINGYVVLRPSGGVRS
jgi:hypothetical protein